MFFFVTTRKFVIKRIVGTKTQRTYRFNTRHAKTTKRKIMGRLPCHVKIKQGINVLYAEEPRKTGIIWYSDIVQNVMVTLNIVRITFIHTFI